MMLKNLIGNRITLITKHPDEWVSFAGPDVDAKRRSGFFAPPWKNSDGNYDLIFIAWNEDGVICEVSGQGEYYKEVIA